jgi:hypothetical protein
MRGNQVIDDGSVTVEGPERADLISLHESAVAFDIGCEDRGGLPFDGVRFQDSAPPRSTITQPGKRSEGCKPFSGPLVSHIGLGQFTASNQIATYRLGRLSSRPTAGFVEREQVSGRLQFSSGPQYSKGK